MPTCRITCNAQTMPGGYRCGTTGRIEPGGSVVRDLDPEEVARLREQFAGRLDVVEVTKATTAPQVVTVPPAPPKPQPPPPPPKP